jgi:hypothetical protein
MLPRKGRRVGSLGRCPLPLHTDERYMCYYMIASNVMVAKTFYDSALKGSCGFSATACDSDYCWCGKWRASRGKRAYLSSSSYSCWCAHLDDAAGTTVLGRPYRLRSTIVWEKKEGMYGLSPPHPPKSELRICAGNDRWTEKEHANCERR